MILKGFGASGLQLPVIGQGTWRMGESARGAGEEIRALRLGIDLGMTHIDTAEMYGSGSTEELVGRATAGIRHKVFLTSKVLPSNASRAGVVRACERSLKRLGTDYLDLYLLHWWGRHPIGETMGALEELVAAGKVRMIGVSNLDAAELEQARRALTRERIVCNQVCYHLNARGIEWGLVRDCALQGIAVVGYSPFGSGDFPAAGSRPWRALESIARRHGRTPRQVALNFLTRGAGLFSIPKAATPEHVRENAASVGWELTPEDVALIDEFFPPPSAETPLAMI